MSVVVLAALRRSLSRHHLARFGKYSPVISTSSAAQIHRHQFFLQQPLRPLQRLRIPSQHRRPKPPPPSRSVNHTIQRVRGVRATRITALAPASGILTAPITFRHQADRRPSPILLPAPVVFLLFGLRREVQALSQLIYLHKPGPGRIKILVKN